MITEIFRGYVKSYKSLPLNLYHIQWKFRDEQRPRFGVMRGREFLMKDGYSFDIDEAAAKHSYNQMFVAYLRTFARMGLKAIPMRAETGPIGGDHSHEFIVLAETGESGVFCNKDVLDLPIPPADVDYKGDLSGIINQWTSIYAATEDVHDAARFESEVPEEKRLNTRGIEVGQIFYFGTKYSDKMQANVAGPDGAEVRLLRRRRVASARRDHRGLPRRQRHHLAGGSGAVPRGHPQPQAGLGRYRRRLRGALQGADGQGRRRAL
jgi:prolyl-tRNA synthetase